MKARNARMIGWRTWTPLACAMAPTANGRTAAPPPPNAAAKPMALTCRFLGSSFVATTMAAGNKGPRKNPRKALKMALEMKLGTNQNRSSRTMHARR